MSKRYTPEQREFLRAGYLKMTIRSLTKEFNAKFGLKKSYTAISTFLFKSGYKCGRTGSDKLMPIRTLLTEEQANFVKKAYKRLAMSDLVISINEKFGLKLTERQLKAYCYNHRIRSGRTGRFVKGSRPWNKETTGLMPPNPTQFKKGHIPSSLKPLWSERISKDGYIEIKVPIPDKRRGLKTRWMLKQRWVYQLEIGQIPDNKIVSFINSNPLDCDPNNLMLISRAEMLKLNQNGYRCAHDKIKPSVLTLSKLQVAARERMKK